MNAGIPEWWPRPVLSEAGQAAIAEARAVGLPPVVGHYAGPPIEYRSAGWDLLDEDDPARTVAMRRAADCWVRLTSSPHLAGLVGELLEELAEWDRRRVGAESSHAVSEFVAAHRNAIAPSYAAIHRRRYGGHGDIQRWVAHGADPCPLAPCVGLECPARGGFRGRDQLRAAA